MNHFLRTLAVACVAACAALTPMANAEDAERTPAAAESAQAAYERGIELRRTDPAASLQAFRDSAERWERIRAAGAENGPLEFNLGNAWMESGDVGRAIAAYLRAERFMPGDADLAHNLARARSTVSSSFERTGGTLLVDSVASWWNLVPRGTRLTLGWLCWFGFWALLAARFAMARSSGHIRHAGVWRSVLGTLCACWVIFGGSIAADEALHAARPRAVLVESGVTLRKGNGDGFEPAFVETLGAGVECTVIDTRPGWLRIELPDGRSGWIREAQAARP